MNNEVDKEMKRCLLLLVCAVLVFALGWFFIRCSTVGIMSFKSRGIYPVEKLDSICEANSIPRDLELWRQTNFQLDDGTILRRYTFIETLWETPSRSRYLRLICLIQRWSSIINR